MRLLIVLCHPWEGSFNHAEARLACEAAVRLGHVVYLHDLYSERFDPVLTLEEIRRKFSFDTLVQRYSGELADAQGLVFFHPEWWGGPPALLKGWLDRVFAPGVAYEMEGEEFIRKRKVPLLKGKKALVFVTSDSTTDQSSSTLRDFWQEGVFGYCGITESDVHVFRDLYHADHERRKSWLVFIEKTMGEWFPREAAPSN